MKAKQILFNYNITEASEEILAEISRKYDCSRAYAKKLFCNALLYNVVRDEIFGQIEFLMTEGYEEECL